MCSARLSHSGRWCDYLAVDQIFSLKWSLRFLPTQLCLTCFQPPLPILSFDLSALYLVTLATSELKEFLARARGGAIRIMKIVIRNGKHEMFLVFVKIWHHQPTILRGVELIHVFVCRGVGARLVQRASTELGQGLRSVPASSAHTSGTLLHPLPSGLPECTGIRVDLHRLVTWPVTSMSGAADWHVGTD